MTRSFFLAVALSGSVLAMTGRATTQTLYMIGNSLTWDSRPRALGQLADTIGGELEVGYHILTASTLPTISENPDTTSEQVPASSYGPLSEALPTYAWDAVSMQMHPRKGATLATETSAIETIVGYAQANPDNADTLFYLFQPWPATWQWGEWLEPVSTAPDAQATARHDYAYLLLDRVRGEMPSNDFLLIPTGDVFFELDQRMQAGQVPGFSSITQLYRNSVHLNATGQYVAAMTFLAAVLGSDPTGPLPTEGQFSASTTLDDDALRTALQAAVWDVVRENPATGLLGDMEWDGDVDFDDLEPFALALRSETEFEARFDVPASVRGDFDGDGDIDFDDVQGMAESLSSANSVQAVPEPAGDAAALSAVLALAFATTRRRQRTGST